MDSTILLVDDEAAIRTSFKRLFRRDKLRFLEASNGREALRLVAMEDIDLILLDLQMPIMNGFSFLEHFRKEPANRVVPICVMTAGSEIDDRRKAIDLGADDFVLKPTEPVELRTRMKSLLRIGNYQQQLSELNKQLEMTIDKRTRDLCATVERLENAQRETDLAYRETILRLTMAAEMKDACTSAHLERMSHAAALLATKCGWPKEDAALLVEAAKMHDIGKLGIPDEVLNKPGSLNEQEFAVIQQHPEIGARILAGSKSKLVQMGGMVALTHHERFDGTGYPQGLAGKAIPEVGRICAIVDVFDALMTSRPYKDAWSLEKTLSTMRSEGGKHFDPDLLALFLDDIQAFCDIHARFSDDDVPLPDWPNSRPDTDD